jgi:hypothetical protein
MGLPRKIPKSQNVMDMTIKLKELKILGYIVTQKTVATLSPYITEHIRQFGDYVVDLSNIPDPLEFEIQIGSSEP